MKKFLLPILLLSVTVDLCAKDLGGKIEVSGVSVERFGDLVNLSFTAEINKGAVGKSTTLVYAPQITDGEHIVSFPAVIVQGRRASLSWDRHEWGAGQQASYPEAYYARTGETVRYRASVPFQHWMHGSDLTAEKLTAGCCSSNMTMMHMVSGILPAPVPEPEPVVVAEVPKMSVADSIAQVFPFVLPSSEFDPERPIRFYDDERDNAITIYYRINSHEVEPGYAGNEQTLTNLKAAVEIVRQSIDSEVSLVVVAGFASPEGPFELNDRLAWERAVAVKDYVMRETGLPGNVVRLYNGSADWQGLRLLVYNDRTMPGREEILDIIDNRPVWDSRTQTGRITLMRQVQEGRAYRYMAENHFPKLRNGAFIRVYYDNKDN